MRRSRITALLAALALLSPFPALAQRAPTLDMTTVRNEPNYVFLMAGPLPAQRPPEPVELWTWTLFRTPQANGTDSLAVLHRYDCAAGSMGTAYAESYANDRLTAGLSTPVTMVVPPANTINALLHSFVCNPASHPRNERLATLAQAWQLLRQSVPGQ